MDLQEIARCISKCTACPLHETRTNTVPGDGDNDAKLVIIGEAPGAREDKAGIPFIGSAGKILTEALEQAGLERKDVFITNTVKCRPPKNRDPKPQEVLACAHFLKEQMKEISPKIFLILGNISLKKVFGKESNITEMRGTLQIKDGYTYFITFHPAATIYNQKLRPQLFQDFQTLATHLNK